MRRHVRAAFNYVFESALLAAVVLALQPAADFLPRTWARAAARILAAAVALSPTQGFEAYAMMRGAFGLSRIRALIAAQQWLARPFLDFVTMRRVIGGREKIHEWKIIETGSEAALKLKDSGKPFIIATGHFARESHLGIFLPQVIPHCITTVAAPLPPNSRDPLERRRRLQYRQLLEALPHVRPQGLKIAFTGGFSSRYDEYLNEPGRVLLISSDAYWKGGGAYRNDASGPRPKAAGGAHIRPFAGLIGYRLATGTAFLSRFVQCPILTCITYMRDDGAVVVEWGEPIPPAASDDKQSDLALTDRLLLDIERAVGLRPSQYVLNIGGSRRWNPAGSQWLDIECSSYQGAKLQ